MSEIAVIGAGAWGTAISIVLGRKKTHHVRLWAHEAEVRDRVAAGRVNQMFLPGQPIPESVLCTNSFEEALLGAEIVVSVMPSHHTRRVFHAMRPHLRPDMLFVSATKGIENDTLLRMTEVITEILEHGDGFRPRIGALSGPSFAKEVAKGDPTAITVASSDKNLAGVVQKEFSDPRFRVYTNDDVVGVELGGSLKNVIAIAAGILYGLDLG
ncbi:MAG: 2-dehydropantoate 2-reductase N-terminal domain-containing protein, partial [Candidatus Korobacteraceae bacterium]